MERGRPFRQMAMETGAGIEMAMVTELREKREGYKVWEIETGMESESQEEGEVEIF